jgi:ribosome-associated protein
VSASTRLPASTRAATAPVVWSSPSSRAKPIARSASPSWRRDIVVELVTKRSRCPAARSLRTASTAPGIGSPETCSTPSTSSRIAAMDAESMRREIRFRVSRSSGPGGQHAQKTSSRVEALFDVEGSEALSEAERALVLERLGAVVRAIAQDERSQAANRELAAERVIEQVRKAARPRRRRKSTQPSAASREQRLDEKRARGATKRLRQPPAEPD